MFFGFFVEIIGEIDTTILTRRSLLTTKNKMIEHLTTLVLKLTAKEGIVGIHSSGFRDFLLKSELLRYIMTWFLA